MITPARKKVPSIDRRRPSWRILFEERDWIPPVAFCASQLQERIMATSNSPLAPDPVTDIDGPEVHQHNVPIVNVELPPDEDLGERVPVGEEGNVEYEDDLASRESV
jgi:hypothetical protein